MIPGFGRCILRATAAAAAAYLEAYKLLFETIDIDHFSLSLSLSFTYTKRKTISLHLQIKTNVMLV